MRGRCTFAQGFFQLWAPAVPSAGENVISIPTTVTSAVAPARQGCVLRRPPASRLLRLPLRASLRLFSTNVPPSRLHTGSSFHRHSYPAPELEHTILSACGTTRHRDAPTSLPPSFQLSRPKHGTPAVSRRRSVAAPSAACAPAARSRLGSISLERDPCRRDRGAPNLRSVCPGRRDRRHRSPW